MAETGLIVEVPQAEALVGELRMRYDESARLGVPAHITVLFPFMAPAELTPQVLAELRSLLLSQAAFGFQLGSVGRFPATTYLEPQPREAFVALTEAIWRAFPAFPPFGGEFPSIIPHLTVAHGSEPDAVTAGKAIATALSEQGPVRSVCSSVVLMENSSGGWTRMHEFLLAARS